VSEFAVGFGLVLVLLVAVLIVVELSGRIGVPYPILLVLGGLLLALIPNLPTVTLEPDLVLLVFLPPLIYIAAYETPLRDLRRYRRAIALLSVGLVLFTILVVAGVAALVMPGLHPGTYFALGAIVAPTDAIAATSIFRRLNTPRRIVTILEGESLLNDAAALVAYRVAVAAVVGVSAVGADGLVSDARIRFDGLGVAVDFAAAAFGGVAVGLIVAYAFSFIYARLSDPPVEVGLSLVIPYVAFLPADALHLSGVLAAVVAGLILGRRASRILSSDTRLLGGSVWKILTFLLNGFAFILIGLQLPVVLSGLADRPVLELVGQIVAIVVAVVVARFAWVFPSTYVPRWLSAAVRRSDPIPAVRAVFVVSWAGLRGAVSLAAALALPQDFPERNLILLLTFSVILATLVGQGLSLPLLLRWFRLADDGGVEREEILARTAATEAGLDEVIRLRPLWPTHGPLFDGLESSLRDRSEHLPTEDEDESAERRQERQEHEEIRHDVITAQRIAVIEMRDRGEINDEVLRLVERELDLEELRMEG
jgi:CPA1 family monovalent cation:H+ antiporter